VAPMLRRRGGSGLLNCPLLTAQSQRAALRWPAPSSLPGAQGRRGCPVVGMYTPSRGSISSLSRGRARSRSRIRLPVGPKLRHNQGLMAPACVLGNDYESDKLWRAFGMLPSCLEVLRLTDACATCAFGKLQYPPAEAGPSACAHTGVTRSASRRMARPNLATCRRARQKTTAAR
jgi:hypothetical protein